MLALIGSAILVMFIFVALAAMAEVGSVVCEAIGELFVGIGKGVTRAFITPCRCIKRTYLVFTRPVDNAVPIEEQEPLSYREQIRIEEQEEKC